MRLTAKLMRLGAALIATSLTPQAAAVTNVPGTNTYYSTLRDPITDINKSFIVLQEVNSYSLQTAFVVRCSRGDSSSLWADLQTKNWLYTEDDADMDLYPAVTLRLGSDAPIVLRNSDVTSVYNSGGYFNDTSIGLHSSAFQTVVRGLNSGKKLVVRVNRPSGGQSLTYTFSAQGFASAWSKIGGCAPYGSGRPAPSSASGTAATTSQAPKFTKWYFTTCRDASSGVARTGLLAGRAHLCDLVIETIPNGARPTSASFRYELEYREGNRTGKLMLDSEDYWPSSGGPITKFRQEGNRLIFTLPLNVRVRPNRVYTSINTTATINFDNGSSKRVYEPLPVRPGN